MKPHKSNQRRKGETKMNHLFVSTRVNNALRLLAGLALTAAISLTLLTQTALALQDNQEPHVFRDSQRPLTAFKYQGRLEQDGMPANGTFDFQFTLCTGQTDEEKLVTLFKDNVTVTQGTFTVNLDFGGAVLYKPENWLEIAVRSRNDRAKYPYTNLSPRQVLKLATYDNEALVTESGSASVLSGSKTLMLIAAQESSGMTREGERLSISVESDPLGIKTKQPRAKLDIDGYIHASGPIKTGNSLSLDGVLHTLTATTTSNLATSKKLFIGLDPSSGPNFFDIGVGIGTKDTVGARLRVFAPQTPNIALSSSQPGPGVKATLEFGIATCSSCYSTIATPGDVVIRGDADDTEDMIIAVRSFTANPLAGAIRFTTGTQATEAERMTILNNGFVGVGTNSPPALFAIGNGNPFQVNGIGDIVRVKNVPYSWPAIQGAPNTVLTNNGSGGLSWAPASGGVSGSCTNLGGTNFVTKWSSSSTITCSQIFDDVNHVGIGTTTPTTKLQVIDNSITTAGLAAVKVDFTNLTTAGSALGLDINSPTLNLKNSNTGVRAKMGVNLSNGFIGTAEGRLSEAASFNAFGRLVGVTGISVPTNLMAGSPSGPSFAVGGLFQNLPATSPTFSTLGIIWVGGVYGEIANTFNANPPNGAIAAVIGVDNSTGLANHYAGYFAGKVLVNSLAAGPNQSLCISPAGVLSSCTSDGTLKTNIRQLTNVLEKVDKIRGVSFNWIGLSKAAVSSTGQRNIGVIAQEVEAVFPEAVTNSDNGYKAVDYNALTGILLQAVKELKAENDSLKRKIEALEKTIVKR